MARVIITGLLALGFMSGGKAGAAEPEAARFIGCWEMAEVTKCGRNSSKICFGPQGRAMHSGYLACESDGFAERFGYKIAGGLVTLKSEVRKLDGFCKGSAAPSGLELSCDEAVRDFTGKYVKLCSKLNADGSDCNSGLPKDDGAAAAKDKIN